MKMVGHMTLAELVTELKNRGITFGFAWDPQINEEKLAFGDPYKLMDPTLLAEVNRHRTAIEDIVRQQEGRPQ